MSFLNGKLNCSFMGTQESDHYKSHDNGYFCRMEWIYGGASTVSDKVSLLELGSKMFPS